MLPLPHMSQITAYPNRPFPLNADRAIFRCYNTCCHHPSTMTGHKPKSHKKRITTRKQNTDGKGVQKKLQSTDPLEVITTPPVVTQTPLVIPQ
jgi:hypothetical protein